MHGWIILDKPLGLGSTQAVAAVKRNLRSAGFGKVKVGHGGTLDPLASGILPIAFGEATKTVPFVQDGEKAYRFTVRWGIETDSDDSEGAVVRTTDLRPAPDQVAAALSAGGCGRGVPADRAGGAACRGCRGGRAAGGDAAGVDGETCLVDRLG